MGQVLQSKSTREAPSLRDAARDLRRPKPIPAETPPDRAGARYPLNRTFKFAIPSLQLKSGVRFELANDCSGEVVEWEVAFYFGTSKAIHSICLNKETANYIRIAASLALNDAVAPHLERISSFVEAADISNMQLVWAHQGPGGTRAFMLLDKLDEMGSKLTSTIAAHAAEASKLIEAIIHHQYGAAAGTLPGLTKLTRNAAIILAGLLVGSTVNPLLHAHTHRNSGVRGRAAL